MRRLAAGLATALLALVLAPGAALGVPLGDLDQSADFGTNTFTFDSIAGVTQTVIPAHTGVITYLQLYCSPMVPSATVNVAIGSISTSSSCTTAGWLNFNLIVPIVGGVQYTIAIDAGGVPLGLGVAASDYPGGAATDVSTGLPPVIVGDPDIVVSDFAFKTYVVALAETTYSWNPTHVSPGTSTAVTLTTATTFDALPVDPTAVSQAAPAALPADFYTVKLGALPAWFSPNGITCSAQVAPADCTVAKYQAGIHPAGDGSLMTVTIAITGVASPAAADAGQTGIASGQGCVSLADSFDVCDPGQAGLAVGSQTPPPTSTFTGPRSAEGQATWYPLAALAMLGGLLLVLRLRVQRRRAGRA